MSTIRLLQNALWRFERMPIASYPVDYLSNIRRIKAFPKNFFLTKHFFVVGCGHSGTSITLALLDNHSKINALIGETQCFILPPRKQWKELWRWAKQWEESDGVLAEKTPKHVRHTRRIKEIFPNSIIVAISRNPLDNIASLKLRYGNINKALNRYITDNKKIINSKYNGYIDAHVLYEDLVVNPEKVISEIINLAGFEYEESILDNEHSEKQWYSCNTNDINEIEYTSKTHKYIRNWQINQSLFDGRGKYKSILMDEEIIIIKNKARKIATEIGYNMSDIVI